ncbi:MAG TPA: DUF554 domain-containing protein [Prolixibacteraceae bacterium]|nr:DUF554 domain-containing protein [Prolixibacteraceae bacterium]HPR62257.1 DUF554 domain-containing protein [Prolixibacteraceae bacterium]
MLLFGTIVNVLTIIAGSLVGVFFHSKLPKRFTTIIFQAIGLFTLYIGITMTMKTGELLILIFSIIIGSIIGEWAKLENHIEGFGNWVKRKIKSKNATFSEGMVTAFLLFCMGSMTILGAFDEGTRGNSDLLVAKSVMDGFSSLALASALGIGVLFSIFPLLLFQGGLTLLAWWLGNLMPVEIINELTAVGGLMLVGLGISIMDIKRIKVLNMLPSLLIAVVLAYIFL